MLNLEEIELQYVTNQAGERTAVLLPIAEFRELVEDIEDLAAIAERRAEPTVSHDKLLAELKRDGLIQGRVEAFRREGPEAASESRGRQDSASG
jgi:hypothetical protein